MLYYIDKNCNFIEFFNPKNGTLIRSNIIEDGIETNREPFMRSFPELIDIGIMGTCQAGLSGLCKNAGVDCYQNAINNQRKNMSLASYEMIISQCQQKTFQVALGGAGDPNKHDDFREILKITRDKNIIPNLTTSGYNLTDDEIKAIREYCGAVAVSFYSTINKNGKETSSSTIKAIQDLVSAGCITNIHFVLSKASIDEAIFRLKNNLFPKNVNAIIFLLYKPVGLALKEKMLMANDPKYLEFLEVATYKKHEYNIGFDSCQTPALLKFCPDVAKESLEFCEAARFSMYIDCDLIAYPCSFGHDYKDYSVDLNYCSVEQAWNSEPFNSFRYKQNKICSECSQQNCRNCSYDLGVNICGNL